MWHLLFALAGFTIEDVTLSPGSPSALKTKVLRNDAGESLQVVYGSGGKTARLVLKSVKTGRLRDVLVPQTDAAAIRDTANGIHYAGSILAPFANRVANGTYTFFGKAYHLPRNECTDVRCDALHGFLFNRSLRVVDSTTSATGASLTLGYSFDGASTPGWPFHADVNVTYALFTVGTPAHTRLRITIRALNTNTDGSALPWTTSWHPYFAVSDVATTKVAFDTCGGGAWRHLLSGPGAPRVGDLIPTGLSDAWTTFDGTTPIGGSETRPTYFDDEFTTTLPGSARPEECADGITQRIIDGNETTVLTGEHMQFRAWQIFTGAKEGWGWDAIALEPMSGLADAFNNGAGLTVLMPGEAFEGSFSVWLE